MIKRILLICAIAVSYSNLYAVENLQLTIKGGFSVPNDELGNVYNSETMAIEESNSNGETIVNFRGAESKMGYTIGVKAALPLAEFFHGYAHIGVHQMGEKEYTLFKGPGSGGDDIGTVTASQFVIPLGVGGEIRFLEIAAADLYVSAQMNFNYVTSDIEIVAAGLDDQFDATSEGRLGYGIGVGSDFDLKFLTLNTELMFQALNTGFSEDEEDTKTLVSLTVGLVF